MSKLATRYLQERGYRRYRCRVCGSYFWSLVERDTCGDSPCQPYEFLNNSPVRNRPENLIDTREKYLRFFEKRGHTIIPRYPVVAARWREDVYLVGASIYVFQPWVTSGIVPPPANPLVISQPCIRFTDIDIVGRSGRHLTGFEMMAHHAFNYPDKHVYWIEETVQLAHEFFTKELGIPEEEITYKESTWMGGGNAGECFEVLVRGLEVATLVFMHYKVREDGSLEEMNMKIVDTGYGLERIYWLSTGLPNVYEAVFQDLVQDLRRLMNIDRPDPSLLSEICRIFSQMSSEDLSRLDIYDQVCRKIGIDRKDLKKLLLENEAIYVTCDHARSLAWMVNDGVLPSNSGIGYLARLLIRRVLRYLESLKIEVDISELFSRCMSWLSKIYPELREIENVIVELVSLEKTKFKEAIASAKTYIEKTVKKSGKITVDDLVKLYDAYGVPPELVADICSEKNIQVEIPSNFYSILIEKKQREGRKVEEEEEKETIDVSGIEKTRELFYENPYLREFESNVIRCLKSRDGKYHIVLRETAFYPEGGGQPSDRGVIITDDGVRCDVEHVFKIGNVIVHKCSCDGDVKEGSHVRGVIDWNRRYSLMKMHTGTHILLQALRRVLGPHIWQAGAQKDIPYSRLDITHYKVLTDNEIRKVEDLCMNIIERGLKVSDEFLIRTEAEVKYGVRIYQGGFIPSPILRIVKIVEDDGTIFDVQACGGTHLRSTLEVGALKIVRVERLQEGVIRIIFTTGSHVIEHVRKIESIVRELSHKLGCSENEILKKIDKLIEDESNLEKKCRYLEKIIVKNLIDKSLENSIKISNIIIIPVVVNVDVSDQVIQDVAREVTSREGVLLMFFKTIDSRVILQVYSSPDVAKKITVRDLIKKLCQEAKCRGGGGSSSGQAVFTGFDLNNVLNIVKDAICRILSF